MPPTAAQLADLLYRYADGRKVNVITDGGVYKIVDFVVSQVTGEIMLVGQK